MVPVTGEYRIGIKFNDKHVPDSPFKVYVTPAMGEARKVEVAQFPDQGSLANKACNFLILRNGAPYHGHIDCKVLKFILYMFSGIFALLKTTIKEKNKMFLIFFKKYN